MTDKEKLPYRPCAGMMMFNDEGRIFMAQRIDQTAEAWQMPQGGIDKGEDPGEAALRELKEEIGTDKVELLAQTDDWLTYDLPEHLVGKVWKGRYRGQKMKWFVYRFLGRDEDINLETDHQEFSEWKWIDLSDLPDMIVPFKRDLYQALIKRFGGIIAENAGRNP
ncbi:RNA pyrophosphohydrolase [Emcibacter sp.]|uniref:RNA pyrophosphohydrolase n=1 Tax=Emcibacter sp. TaxID=1979954 RepID=UPI003A905436